MRRFPLLILFGLLLTFPGTAQAASVPLFGAPEHSAADDARFQQAVMPLWQRVISVEKDRPSFTERGDNLRPPDARQWRALVQRARASDETAVLRMINGYFNQWRPLSDNAAFGTPEYWSSPREFIANRGGDCEDYSIAKYMALRFLGIPVDRMRIVIVRMLNAQGQPLPELHAVLAVQRADTWFILDSNARPRDNIFPHTQYKGRFVPLYSFNENHAWKHVDDPKR